MTSPVDFISGPRMVSTPGNLAKGNTGDFTKKFFTGNSSAKLKSANFFPVINRAATFASGTPVALLTNGTVRDARGFTSRTYTTSSLIAYWTFIRPTTLSALASVRV